MLPGGLRTAVRLHTWQNPHFDHGGVCAVVHLTGMDINTHAYKCMHMHGHKYVCIQMYARATFYKVRIARAASTMAGAAPVTVTGTTPCAAALLLSSELRAAGATLRAALLGLAESPPQGGPAPQAAEDGEIREHAQDDRELGAMEC